MKLYLSSQIVPSADGMLYGSMCPLIEKDYETVLSETKSYIEKNDFEGYIYSDIENKVYSYSADDKEWSVEDKTITDDMLQNAEEYVSYYIFDAEFPRL